MATATNIEPTTTTRPQSQRGSSTTAKARGAATKAEAIQAISVEDVRKSLYVSLGVGDLAVEKLREVPSELPRLQTRLQDGLSALQTQLQGELPAQARAQAHALREQVADYAGRATEIYRELAARGEQVAKRR